MLPSKKKKKKEKEKEKKSVFALSLESDKKHLAVLLSATAAGQILQRMITQNQTKRQGTENLFRIHCQDAGESMNG